MTRRSLISDQLQSTIVQCEAPNGFLTALYVDLTSRKAWVLIDDEAIVLNLRNERLSHRLGALGQKSYDLVGKDEAGRMLHYFGKEPPSLQLLDRLRDRIVLSNLSGKMKFLANRWLDIGEATPFLVKKGEFIVFPLDIMPDWTNFHRRGFRIVKSTVSSWSSLQTQLVSKQ